MIWATSKTKAYLSKQEITFGFSFLALGGRNKAFTKIVHTDKNHPGQAYFAERIYNLTQTNEI